jgi:uncharacterized Fe-S cluster protein YjdI
MEKIVAMVCQAAQNCGKGKEKLFQCVGMEVWIL